MRFSYPRGMDDESVEPYQRKQMSRAHEFFGSKDVDGLFYGAHASTAPTPWPRAGMRKAQAPYDKDIVRDVLSGPVRTEEFDPRNLHSTQPSITRGGVDYYLGDEYQKTGRTYAEQGNPGNRFPVVYQREDGQNLLLSGHHRATAALLQGKQFEARPAAGPWGRMRGQ